VDSAVIERKSVSIDGSVFFYDEVGHGQPIVFLHGYPGRPQDFRWLIPYLDGFQLLFFALPGLDISPLPERELFRVSDRADYVLSCCDEIGLEDFFLVGHSMGGMIATHLATHHANRVLKLILISAVGPKPYQAFRRSRPDIAYQVFTMPILGRLLSPIMRYAFLSLGFPKGVSNPAMKYVLGCANSVSFSSHANNLRSLSLPVLSLWATDDPLIEPQSFEDLEEIIPVCRSQRFTSGGHNPQKKQASEVACFIKEFLLPA